MVLDIHLHLMAPPGHHAGRRCGGCVSFPVALAQCRRYLAEHLPGAEVVAANSTADAARQLGEHAEPGTAAIAPRLAAELYGLSVLVEDVEDYPGQPDPVRGGGADRAFPRPTGHDRTSIVCFQRADRPGSLHGILGQFAARNINLTKLESRPTKRGLGDYCFVIDLDGHLDDEVVADCLRDLHAELAGGEVPRLLPGRRRPRSRRRQQADDAWREADAWLEGLRRQIG